MPDPCRSEKANPYGIWLTFFINVLSWKAFSRHSILHLYSAHRATLVPDLVGLFSSSSAASTNGCFDLSYRNDPQSGDWSFHREGVLAPERGKLETAWFFGGEAQLLQHNVCRWLVGFLLREKGCPLM